MQRLNRLARRFGAGRAIGLVLLAALIGVRYWDPGPVEELRLRGFDFYQNLQPRDAKFRPVVIVDLDEASLKEYGQWPWPRTLVADLVTKLSDLGAAAIGFDILFSEPDRTSPSVIARTIKGLDQETEAKLSALPSNDDVLAKAVENSRVVLGRSGDGVPQPDARPLDISGFAIMGPPNSDPKRYLVSFPVLLGNLQNLEKAAAGRGLFSFRPDRDGIVRRAPLAMVAAGQLVPALSTELLRVAINKNSPLIRLNEGGILSVGVPGYELPTDGNGRVWVYFGRSDRSRYVSAKDVLKGTVPRDRFEKRLVLIGTSAVGLLDLKYTPVDSAMPGVEVHAQIIESAFSRTFLKNPLEATLTEMAVMAVMGIGIVTVGPMIGPLAMLIVGALGAAAVIAASWIAFSQYGLLYDAIFPLLSIIAVYAILVFVNYFREQAGRQRVRSAFGQYLSPTLVEQLAQSPDKLVLGGEEREMTVMFSDVRGFTSISELYKDDPQGLTQLMNRLLTPLTNAIIARTGTIDKYMGDAIMAFWNAPLDDKAHEVHACEAALDMMERLTSLNKEREQEALANNQKFLPIKIGVGLNTGRCVVGNMGSDMRFQYTVLGDCVNLASRLEGQTKSYGVKILIGSRTAQAIEDKFALIELDRVTVKGKTEPETVYAVFGGSDLAQSDEFKSLQAAFASMLARYRAQDWDGATAALNVCRKFNSGLDVSEAALIYAERIEAFRVSPPPAGWDGVFALQTK
ncbi:MAG: CHASE2 domain-containing protein [Xanthobacteraceae bacterium]